MVYTYAGQKHLIFQPAAEGTRTPADFGVPYQDFSIPSFDTVHLHSWFMPHDGTPTFGKPISLLYCHGNGANLSRLAHVTKIFTDFGFEPTFFSYRGYGASDEGELAELNIIGDAVAEYDHIKATKPNQPIFAWGHSLGASVCAGLSVQRKLDGLILEAPFSSIPEMAAVRYPFIPIFPSLIFDEFPTTYFVSHRIGNAPLLIVHSNGDTIIPMSEGKKVFAAASSPKKFLEVADVNHNNFPDVSEKYRTPIVYWVKAVLAGTL